MKLSGKYIGYLHACFPVIFSNTFSGSTKENPEKSVGCGGGAIKIFTEKNLTISK